VLIDIIQLVIFFAETKNYAKPLANHCKVGLKIRWIVLGRCARFYSPINGKDDCVLRGNGEVGKKGWGE
jgi:hypothetical protein